jgi:hypothetical protein
LDGTGQVCRIKIFCDEAHGDCVKGIDIVVPSAIYLGASTIKCSVPQMDDRDNVQK